jgi:hypothetical protein
VIVFRRGISRPHSLILFVLFVLLSGSALSAQTGPSSPIAQRLSPNTVFYMQWSGKASLTDAEKKNHVLQLMEDPAMAPFWLMAAARTQQGAKKSGNPAVTLGMADMLSFLDNSAAFGMATVTDAPKPAGPDSVAPHFGFFLVYDATGKASLIEKIKSSAAIQADGKTPAVVTRYDFGGTPVEVRTTGKDTAYNAQAANYFLASDQKQIIEDLIVRFGKIGSPATSVTQAPGYADIRKFLGSDMALEYFGRIPDVDQWSVSDKSMKSAAQVADNLHLEKIHTMGGGISFAGEATRFRGAVLGDTSPGGLFDLAGSSKLAFQTQAFVNGSEAFSISRFDLPSTYALIRGAVIARLTPQQASSVAMVEAMAQGYLGMPIAEALALFTGEAASVTSYTDAGEQEQVFAIAIQKPEAVLRILRAVGGTKIAAEDTIGGVTYLDVAYPYNDPKTGTQRKKFYYLAVTPQMLVSAPRKFLLRSTVQRLNATTASGPSGGIFGNSEYSQMRSLLPDKLSGLGGVDLTQIPWDKVLANLEEATQQASNQKNAPPPPDLSFLKPEMISRHVRTAVSGWWKDSNGVYFDSYIQ